MHTDPIRFVREWSQNPNRLGQLTQKVMEHEDKPEEGRYDNCLVWTMWEETLNEIVDVWHFLNNGC
jgi:hypothetical protein